MNSQTPQFYTIFFLDGSRFIGDAGQCIAMIREEARDNAHCGVRRMRLEYGASERFRLAHRRGRLIAAPSRLSGDQST